MNTTPKTELLGIFGTPIEHTLSPHLHSILAEKTGKDIVYLAFDTPPEDFARRFKAAKALGARGFNITSPYKMSVMELLDEIDPEAAIVGSVNTAVNENGVWHGYNTDGDGFADALLMNGIDVSDNNTLILGAGGSARSLSYKIAKRGAKSITVTSRSRQNIESIGHVIEKYTNAKFYENYDDSVHYDIIINTTPLGMQGVEAKNPYTYSARALADAVCCDLIYSPWETLFLKEARHCGAKTINGLGMLIMQGFYAFDLFCSTKVGMSYYNEIYDIFSKELRR